MTDSDKHHQSIPAEETGPVTLESGLVSPRKLQNSHCGLTLLSEGTWVGDVQGVGGSVSTSLPGKKGRLGATG